MTHEQVEAAENIIKGTLLVCGFDVKVLYDPCSTYSFATPAFPLHFRKDKETLPFV